MPEKFFSHITSREILAMPERFSRSQGVRELKGILCVPKALRGSWGGKKRSRSRKIDKEVRKARVILLKVKKLRKNRSKEYLRYIHDVNVRDDNPL